MKLFFVTGSLVHGGAERHTITLSNRLAERGHECHFAYVKNDPSQLDRLRGARSVQCLHARRFVDFAAVRKLASLMTAVRPSVIVAANQYALLYSALALRVSGVAASRTRSRLVVTFHSTQVRSMKERLQMLAYPPLFWSADCAVFVCERQRLHWRRRGVFARRNEVIYNGVDSVHWSVPPAAESAALRRALGFAAEDFVIAMSAVLRPEKNHVQLVRAVARLRQRGVPAQALMIGDGETRPAVEALARRLGVADRLAITGFQHDVRPFVAACDVLAITSTTEAFSLAAIEAMAAGRPVVHSNVGGAAEMIRPGENGFLFPVGDTRELVECLARLADRGARERMSRAAREAVETRFSERAMVERYEIMLQELETERNKRANIRRPAGAH
jgi:glycosyltransferase involved in cell wall biosynthesis